MIRRHAMGLSYLRVARGFPKHGNSMLPIIKSGSLLTFEKADTYQIGDVVFSKVRGRYIDAHKIVKTDQNKGYLIANNHGYENGWTKQVFGKVTEVEFKNEIKKL